MLACDTGSAVFLYSRDLKMRPGMKTAHSGTLATADEVLTGLLHQLGAIGVDDLDEMIECAELLGHGRLPEGRRLMVVTDLIRASTQSTVGLLLLLGIAPIWMIGALQLIAGTATAFYYPATTGLTTSTVPRSELQRANALLSLSTSLSACVGPLGASLLVLTAGAGWALVIDGLSFIGSAVLLSRLSIGPQQRERVERHFLTELAEGFAEVRQRTWVWNSILAFAASNMAVATLFVVGPARLLHDEGGVFKWGTVVAAISMGEVIGDLLALRFRPKRMLLTARVVELAQVPLLICVALVGSMPWLLTCAVLWGIGITYPDSLWYTALQQHLPEQSISRVSSYDFMGSLVLRPVGYSVAAVVASSGALVETLLGAAVLIVVTRAIGMLVPSVRNLRRLEAVTS